MGRTGLLLYPERKGEWKWGGRGCYCIQREMESGNGEDGVAIVSREKGRVEMGRTGLLFFSAYVSWKEAGAVSYGWLWVDVTTVPPAVVSLEKN